MCKRTNDSMKPLPYHWSESIGCWILCLPLLQSLCPEEKPWGTIQKSSLMVPAWEPIGTMLAPRTDLCYAEHGQVEGLPGEGLSGTHGPEESFSWREACNHTALPGFIIAPDIFMLHQLGTLIRSVWEHLQNEVVTEISRMHQMISLSKHLQHGAEACNHELQWPCLPHVATHITQYQNNFRSPALPLSGKCEICIWHLISSLAFH